MARSRHIAFLSEHASPVSLRGGADAGGQNVYVDEMSRHLVLCGYTVDIFTRLNHPDDPMILDWASGVKVINLPAGPARPYAKDDLWPHMPAFRDAFLQYAQQSERRYSIIHGNFWMSGWVASELRQRLHIPTVQIFHAMGKTKQRYQGDQDTSPSERIAIEEHVVQQVDRLIAQCPDEQTELLEDYAADPEKVMLIPSGVNGNVFHPVSKEVARRYVGVSMDDFVIVYVGRMLPRKDVRNVVHAVAELLAICRVEQPSQVARIKLLLVGGESAEPDPVATPEIGVLQQLSTELGIEQHVRFIGKRQQETLCYYYSAGDAAVSTPWYEPFGLTPLEGMACGSPFVGSAVGGITYTVVDEETGFLVPPRDSHALARRFYQLLMQPELAVRLGHAARLRVEHEFSWLTVAERTAALYEELLQKQRDAVSRYQ